MTTNTSVGASPSTRPSLASGALAAALVTTALLAVFYLGWKLAGTPFVPYDGFDWTVRTLPGGIVTFGIDTMVALLQALGLSDLSGAAKAAEKTMAIAGLWLACIGLGVALFAGLRRRRPRHVYVPGVALGAGVAIAILLVEASLGDPAPVGPVLGGLWILVAFVGWGAALSWVSARLTAPVIGVGTEGPAGAPQRAQLEQVDRRRFIIRLGGATAAITVVGAGLGRWATRGTDPARGAPWSSTHRLPNADAEVRPAPGTRSELTPVADHYRIDINTSPPVIREADWRLRVFGLVDPSRELTLAELQGYPAIDQFVTMRCISNPIAGELIGTQRWTGVSLARLLPVLGLASTATHLHLRAADGFDEVVALDAIRADARIMLAYAWDGLPLPVEHGYPLRIYIPDVYGMKQPKWIESLEAIDHWVPGYWVRRGWDRDAVMKAVSVIDAVATDMMLIEADEHLRVPIGGIAHTGARGVSRVEVRVDDGPWQAAKLRTALSELTWVIWRYDWPFQDGAHTFAVRCWDRDGALQIEAPSPVRPDGATGLHTVNVVL